MKHLYLVLSMMLGVVFQANAMYIPTTPYTGNFSCKITKATNVHETRTSYRDTSGPSVTERDYICTYSADGLRFESKVVGDERHRGNTVYTFFTNGKIRSFSSRSSIHEEYVYNAAGQIEAVAGKDFMKEYFYDAANKKDSILLYKKGLISDKFYLSSKEVISHSDTGYVTKTYQVEGQKVVLVKVSQYKTDAQKRVVASRIAQADSNGKVKYSDYKYVYTENGYDMIHPVDKGWISKREFRFNEQGDLISQKQYTKIAEKDWTLDLSFEYKYTYGGETSNEAIEQLENEVFAAEGAVTIVSVQSQLPYAVYSISGQLCAQGVLTSTQTSVPLNQGVYIVLVGNERHKVVIR